VPVLFVCCYTLCFGIIKDESDDEDDGDVAV